MMKNLLQKRLKNEKGLTLVELLAVIVILGIIAAIAVPAIGKIIDNTKDKAILADASNILSAAKLAIAEGSCTSDTECTTDDLEGFVEGIDSENYSANKTADGWTVTYDEFEDIKNTKFSDGIDNTYTVAEDKLIELMGNKKSSD